MKSEPAPHLNHSKPSKTLRSASTMTSFDRSNPTIANLRLSEFRFPLAHPLPQEVQKPGAEGPLPSVTEREGETHDRESQREEADCQPSSGEVVVHLAGGQFVVFCQRM